MLNVMRRHAYSWIIRGVLFVIVVVFAFWGIGTGLFNQVKPIASVNGHTILVDQVDRQATNLRRNLQQIYGPNAADALKSVNLRQEALQQMIEQELIQNEARRIGLEVSDDDLQRAIASNKAFQVDGQFDFPTYQAVLQQNDMMPSDFERSERQQMIGDMLRQMVEQGVQVSDDEARLEFDRRNAKLDLSYIQIPFSQFVATVKPTDKEIADYYKRDNERFREPERIKIVFVNYDPAILAEKLNPSDKDIEAYYDKNKKTIFSHPDQVHARHILIAVPGGATEKEKADLKKKAEDVLRQVKDHPADFGKLAARYSDDPGNKFKMGDLGYFGRGQMVKPFEDAAFKLKPGQVTLVETQFGYHILKVDDSRPAHDETLAEARPEIIDTLRRKAGADLARKALNEDLATGLESKTTLNELAEKRGLNAVETPFFGNNEPVKGAENNPELARAAFKLEEGDVRAVTGGGSGYYLVKLLKRQPSHVPPLKEIEAKVRDALVQEQAQKAAGDFAASLLKQIKSPDDFAKVAAANKLLVHNTGEFERSSAMVPTVGRFPEVTDAASLLVKVPGVIDKPTQYAGDSYLFEVLSRKPPGDDDWKKDGEAFTERVLDQRREQAWNHFVDGLKEHARITIDTNQIAGAPTESSM